MNRRIRAALAVVAVGGGVLLVTNSAEANHGTRTLQVHPELQNYPAGSSLPGAVVTAELSSATDATSGDIFIDFEIDSDGDGNTPGSPDATCTIPGPGAGTTTTSSSSSTTS